MKELNVSCLPPLQSRSVTVVIPALNEEGNLDRLLLAIEQAFLELGYNLPVLLIDDGSTDNSSQILAGLVKEYSFLKVIRHPQRRGVAEVWKTALAHVTTDWIFWGQADLESDPQTDIPLLLKACVPGVDAVAGWRQQRGDGKVVASQVANTICRLVFGLKVHDMNWIKLVRRDILSAELLDIATHRYMLAALVGWGYNLIEVPTPWHTRYSGKTKFGRGRLITSAIDFAKLWWWFQTKGRLLPSRSKIMYERAGEAGEAGGDPGAEHTNSSGGKGVNNNLLKKQQENGEMKGPNSLLADLIFYE